MVFWFCPLWEAGSRRHVNVPKRGVCVVIDATEEGPAEYRGVVAFLYYPAREIIHNTGSSIAKIDRDQWLSGADLRTVFL